MYQQLEGVEDLPGTYPFDLRRSEQRYRHLFHHMPIAMFQTSAA